MIRVKLSDTRHVGITFQHVHGQWTLPRNGAPVNVKVITTCRVIDLSDGEVPDGASFQHGTAKCSDSDNFNKHVARKLALERAIVGFTRDERRKIWEAYWNRRG